MVYTNSLPWPVWSVIHIAVIRTVIANTFAIVFCPRVKLLKEYRKYGNAKVLPNMKKGNGKVLPNTKKGNGKVLPNTKKEMERYCIIIKK